MKILVLNSGSSTLKYLIIDMKTKNIVVEGVCERIGTAESFITYKTEKNKIKLVCPIATHKEAIELVLKTSVDKDMGVINSVDEIDAIGHRVVHGGEEFNKSLLVNEKVLESIKKLSSLAPLHNPANALGIEICMKIMPKKPNVAVFDTAFHQTLSPKAFMYALPYEDYTDLGVRKYGFHGTSYRFISREVEKLMGENKKIIVCHLGNGASICAIKNGKSIDTSMGLTPLEGLMMGTRCGDIDPSSIFYIMDKRGLNPEEINERLNKKSGMLGIFGKSSDSRDIEDGIEQGDKRAILTEELYAYRVKAYIGSYIVALEGIDALVFTAGIGENAAGLREKICEGLEFIGVNIDKDVNKIRKSGIVELSKRDSKVKIFKIPTNEEYMIAEDTYNLVNN